MAQRVGKATEACVAHRMSQAVVDGLEAIEVEKHEGSAAVVDGSERRGQRAPVREGGEGIAVRQVAQLILHRTEVSVGVFHLVLRAARDGEHATQRQQPFARYIDG